MTERSAEPESGRQRGVRELHYSVDVDELAHTGPGTEPGGVFVGVDDIGEVDDVVCETETDHVATQLGAEDVSQLQRRTSWKSLLSYGLLPTLVLLLAAGSGYLKWQNSMNDDLLVRNESVQFARDATIEMLSYQPDSVEQELGSARHLLTGDFRNSYESLIDDVVIPGAKQQRISAVATVPAVSSVSATATHAVALLFVNQRVTVGADAPTDTPSSVVVTMDKIDGRWFVSQFEPV